MNKKGILLTVEGVDAAGKKTQVNKLKNKLIEDGYKVKIYAFPEYNTTSGKIIADYLKGEYGGIEEVPKKLICMAYAADRAKRINEIKQLLEEGYIIISDRYTYSNILTIAKLPKQEWDEFMEWIEDLEFNCLGVIKPDYNFYLHVDPEISIKRIKERGKREYQNGKNDIHESNYQLLRNASEAYKYFTDKGKLILINEMHENKQKKPEEVFNLIYNKIKLIIKSPN